MGDPYARHEKKISEPFANALKSSEAFRQWVLKRTRFAPLASIAVLLDDEMMARRSAGSANWWVSHHRGSCKCFGCAGGKETDLLAVLEANGVRFALHFEFKNLRDSFQKGKNQPEAYRLRAECWVTNPPPAVLRHQDADTVLVCSTRLRDFAAHSPKFGATLTLEELETAFPALFATVQPPQSLPD